MNRLAKIFASSCAGLLLTAGWGRGETVFWSDNFEAGAGSRWTTNSVWQIGSPTTGPAININGFRSYSGSNCATTGLKAGAPANADARLICTNYNGTNWLLIPAASQFPRLRFWQWFNYVNGQGYVEIKQSGSTNWQSISATNLSFAGTPNYSSGVWSRPAIDLSAFAGQSVQFAFHFLSGANYGGDLGWCVDDVAVVTGVPMFNNPEGFEAGLGDWSVNSGTWEVGQPTTGPATNAAGFRAHSGTNCAATVLAGNYGYNVDTRLTSPPFLVPSSASPVLRFWQWYSFVNAHGFVEISTGTNNTTSITNTTVTTNLVFSSLNTNIYQLIGAAAAGYSTPFYWNSTIGYWTNATKAMGNVDDVIFETGYTFEAGNAPLSPVAGLKDYYSLTNLPVPRTAAATNYLTWQGMKWGSPTNANDNPIGYFGTNYTSTYTTNTTIIQSASGSWQTISATNQSFGSTPINSGGWTNATLDLSAYAGQTVQVGFHFQSGPSSYATAPGWYVDDLSLGNAPVLIVPANQTIFTGQTLVLTLAATNSSLPAATFSFGPVAVSTNYVVTTDGLLTWTNTAAPPGTNFIYVKVTDNSVPPLAATNHFSLIIVSPPPILVVSNNAFANGMFRLSFHAATNTTWRIDGSTNLTSWQPVLTNLIGTGGILNFTDLLATNFPTRFYRAVYP